MYGRIVPIVLLLAAWPALAAERLTPEEAAQHIGDQAQVCGTVASAKYVTRLGGKPTFLSLDKPHPHDIFVAVIWDSDRASFSYAPESLEGARICVSGTISEYSGLPQIIVSKPSQILRSP